MRDGDWILVQHGAARRLVPTDRVDAIRWGSRRVELIVGDRRYGASDLSPAAVARLRSRGFVAFESALVRAEAIDRMESGPGNTWTVHLRSGPVLRLRHTPDVDAFLDRVSP